MFFISKDYGDNIYGVTDSTDNIEERYSLEDIKKFINQGIKIKGVLLNSDNVIVYPTFKDYCQREIAKLKLLGKDFKVRLSDDFTTIIKCDKDVTSIRIPDFITEIEEKAFEDCMSLESIVLPNSITYIGEDAFRSCISLKSIVIPDSVTEIGDWVFWRCTSLESVVLSNSVTEIGDFAFYNCTSLKSIVIPNSVTKIGSCAFDGCTSLKSIVIPDSVTKAGAGVFRGCVSLIIKCNKGTYAEKYCNDRDIRYEVT